MALRSKFVTTHVQRHGVTHFLAIPLVTPKSRSQVLDLFKCLRDHLTAIGVPMNAIRPPGLLNLSLDIRLRLDSTERMAKATEILKKVSNKEALRTIHGSSTSDNPFRHSSMALPKSTESTGHSMAAPGVSVSGLFCPHGREAEAFRLSARSYDATHRFSNINRHLTHAYQAAGLSHPASRSPDPQVRAATKETLGSHGATVRLVSIPKLDKPVPSNKYPGKLANQYLPPFDARGLLEQYKDHVWMENAPLDRVSICKLGIGKRGAEKLPEVFSIPLS